MSDPKKEKKDKNAEDPSKKIIGILRWVIIVVLAVIFLLNVKDSLKAWFSGIRKESQAEAATIAFRQTERDERQYTVTV